MQPVLRARPELQKLTMPSVEADQREERRLSDTDYQSELQAEQTSAESQARRQRKGLQEGPMKLRRANGGARPPGAGHEK